MNQKMILKTPGEANLSPIAARALTIKCLIVEYSLDVKFGEEIKPFWKFLNWIIEKEKIKCR